MTTEVNQPGITEDNLLKSLEDLQELLSKGQILRGEGSQKGAMKEDPEDDSPDAAPNGTDLKNPGTKMAKAQDDEDEDEKSEDSVDKGMECGKPDADKVDKAMDDDEDDDVEKAGPSASDGKENTKKEVNYVEKPVSKSQDDGGYADVSDWLSHLTEAVVKSVQAQDARLLAYMDERHSQRGELAKAMAGSVEAIHKGISDRHQALEDIEKSAARAPKSVLKQEDIGKSQREAEATQQDALAGMPKSVITQKLMKGLQDGTVTQMDILRYDSKGYLNPELAKSILD